MIAGRMVLAVLVLAGTAAASPGAVSAAAGRAEEKAARAGTPLALEFRLRVAQALGTLDPERSRKLVEGVLGELRGGSDRAVRPAVLQELVELAPKDTAALAPHLAGESRQVLVAVLSRANQKEAALELFRETAAAMKEPLAPADALWLAMNAPSDPRLAAEAYERVIRAARAPDYGAAALSITATFRQGQETVATENARDTLLFLAGSRLYALAPERFQPYAETFAKWKLGGTWAAVRVYTGSAAAAAPEAAAISKRIGTMRGLATDQDRARLTLELVREIRALPEPSQRFGLIRGLSNLATEGDLGKEALGAVAATLAASLRENPAAAGADDYIGLARMARYEHLEVAPDAGLEAATALLALREQIQQENGFALTGMDGKAYTLAGLKGRIVLLNFWATWCPPCRKEMPDMEKLFQAYAGKGLTVIAVSDEDRSTVEQFLAKNHYSFAVALDPDRKVNTAFSVEGIPKSFVFDREGRLAAQAIDMRTGAQFLEMLKLAGLE